VNAKSELSGQGRKSPTEAGFAINGAVKALVAKEKGRGGEVEDGGGKKERRASDLDR